MESKKELLVLALGGNALLDSHHKGTIEEKITAASATAEQLLPLLSSDYRLILTHGNGPQVGNLLIQNEDAASHVPPMPLDVCVAETQGEIGYILQTAIQNIARENNIRKSPVTIMTQVLVDQDDPAFETPAKPVGPFYALEKTRQIIQEKKWKFKEDPAGKGYRRVVPSPVPRKVVQAKLIQELVAQGYIVIAVGGGGIPVYVDGTGKLLGIEAVIDKDLASAQLAIDLEADRLIILTNIDACYLDFKRENQTALREMNLDEANTYLMQGHFSSGSMGPKVAAAVEYITHTGKEALITSIENLADALEGRGGTVIHQ